MNLFGGYKKQHFNPYICISKNESNIKTQTMKLLKKLLTIALMPMILTACHQAQAPYININLDELTTKPESESLKGEVKQYRQISYKVSLEDDVIVKEGVDEPPLEDTARGYNKSGQLTNIIYYDNSGKAANVETFKYDANNRLIENGGLYYGESKGISKFVYNKKGMIEKVAYYDHDDVFFNELNFKYNKDEKTLHGSFQTETGQTHERMTVVADDAGNIVTLVLYDEWGYEEDRMEYTYNRDGWITEKVELDQDFKDVERYSYDEEANITELTAVYSRKDEDSNEWGVTFESKVEYVYEYDEVGNWVQRLEYYDGVLEVLTEREYEYY